MITPEIIEEVKKRLVGVYDPEVIYLFGSYAWGNPDDESDLDLLVVVSTSDEKCHKRVVPGVHALWGLHISKDLMVYTREEFDVRAVNQNTLLYKIKNEGKVLYARG